MPTRAAIVTQARRYIGTPYHHQASAIGVGCDCVGLVRGVWRAFYGPEPEAVPPYAPDHGEAEQIEVLLDQGRRHLVPIEVPAMGDVVLFRMRTARIAKHCAILSSPTTMIHAQNDDCVREVSFSAPWRRLVTAAFAFPGLD